MHRLYLIWIISKVSRYSSVFFLLTNFSTLMMSEELCSRARSTRRTTPFSAFTRGKNCSALMNAPWYHSNLGGRYAAFLKRSLFFFFCRARETWQRETRDWEFFFRFFHHHHHHHHSSDFCLARLRKKMKRPRLLSSTAAAVGRRGGNEKVFEAASAAALSASSSSFSSLHLSLIHISEPTRPY